jgi:glycosyltransferase involved in cell wall biosynthesis
MYKVSVILPIYNVSRYLRKCLDSVCGQTLKELEILCVNDGSTDDSLEIVQEYAARDARIVIITGPNGGYGKAMNKGLDRATGEYVGIVEPDDYVLPEMFEELYQCAKEHDLDFVKSDFNRFCTKPSGEEELKYEQIDKTGEHYGKLLNPSRDPDTIRFTMNTWTGIYRREFLEAHHIRHHETPGASFQDNGFYFQTFAYAERAMILNKAYYRNRRDNPDSSVKNRQKVYCMNIEYDFIRDILMKDRELWERFRYMYWWKKYMNYMFTYERIDDSYKKEYLHRMQREYKRAMQKGELSPQVFTELEWKKIESLIDNADGFYSALRSAGVFRKLLPYIPQSVKQMVLKVMSWRK